MPARIFKKFPVEEPGGYSFQFVKSPPSLVTCVICHLPSKDPYLSECCGHIFCRSCLDQCKSTSRDCPLCRNSRFKTVQNKQIDRKVRNLHVYCTNKERRCTWQGEINNITKHLDDSEGCQYEEVNCSLKCKRKMQRRYLANHVKERCPRREVHCQHCRDIGEHQFIEGKHKEECAKLPLKCPNKCEAGTVPRESMEAHRKECPLEMIQCKYHSVGCEVRMARKKRKSHEEENMEEHLQMTTLKLTKTEDKLLSTEQRVSNLEMKLSCLIHNSTGSGMVMDWASHLASLATNATNTSCPVVIKLTQFTDCMESGDQWSSDPFYTSKNGYKMCLSAHPADDTEGLSVWLHLMKGPYDDELTWPLNRRFEIKLLNQIRDSEHHSMMITYDDTVDDDITGRLTSTENMTADGWGYSQFIPFKKLSETTENYQYLKDDCIYFQVRSYSI